LRDRFYPSGKKSNNKETVIVAEIYNASPRFKNKQS
jgi:hypothetical protein